MRDALCEALPEKRFICNFVASDGDNGVSKNQAIMSRQITSTEGSAGGKGESFIWTPKKSGLHTSCTSAKLIWTLVINWVVLSRTLRNFGETKVLS
jgi:hypothetical protein